MKYIAAFLLASFVLSAPAGLPTIDADDFKLHKYANKIDHFNYQNTDTYQ